MSLGLEYLGGYIAVVVGLAIFFKLALEVLDV